MLDSKDPVVFERQPRLRWRPFGVRRKDVLRELEERDSAADASRAQARTAEAEVERLRLQVEELGGELARTRDELEQLRAGGSIAEGANGHSKFCDCPPSDALLQEMTQLVSMTEDSTQKILEHARVTLQREIEAAGALRDQARAEIAQAVQWRSHWGPIVKAFQDTIRDAQGAIDEIPERIRDALAPLTAAAAALDHELLQFAALGPGAMAPDEPDAATTPAESGGIDGGEATEDGAERPGGHSPTIVLSDPEVTNGQPDHARTEMQAAESGTAADAPAVTVR